MKKIMILLFLISINVYAKKISFVTGNMLYQLCKSENKVNNGLCEGYIAGINDAMSSGYLHKYFQVCLPEGVSTTQLRLILIKYMEQIPQKLHYVAEGIVAEALGNTFPCKKTKKKRRKKRVKRK